MNMYDIYKDYTCVNCKTEEEAKALLKYWAGLGYTWNNGYAISEKNLYYQGPITCYRIVHNNIISVTTTNVYEFSTPNKIPVSYSEYMEREQQKWLREMKKEPIQETEKIKSGTIIHCNTSDEAKKLLQFLKTKGYVWHEWSQVPKEKNSWDYYREHTGYLLWDKKILIRDYWRWTNNARPEECMEFSEFESKYMEKTRESQATKREDPLQKALQVLSELIEKEQKHCDQYKTNEMVWASNAYEKCLNLVDELTKSPADFLHKYQSISEMTTIKPGDIVEIQFGKESPRILITDIYKHDILGLNLDANFAQTTVSHDVPIKKVGHADLQEVLSQMLKNNAISIEQEEWERE